MSENIENNEGKPKVGIFTFSCCEGCQFTIFFLDNLMEILDKLDIQYFHLLKEKNKDVELDLAFVEGAITEEAQIEKLKNIRKKSKFLVALGACACHGGVPSMRNFIEEKELSKYTYGQCMKDKCLKASGIGQYIKVDYYMYGCPMIKEEFVDFVNKFTQGEIKEVPDGPVCLECPRRGKNCFLVEKKPCLGAVTRRGCNAICLHENVPCVLCRGPLDKADFTSEVKLFKSWGLSEQEVFDKIRKFKDIELKEDTKKEDAKQESDAK